MSISSTTEWSEIQAIDYIEAASIEELIWISYFRICRITSSAARILPVPLNLCMAFCKNRYILM